MKSISKKSFFLYFTIDESMYSKFTIYSYLHKKNIYIIINQKRRDAPTPAKLSLPPKEDVLKTQFIELSRFMLAMLTSPAKN